MKKVRGMRKLLLFILITCLFSCSLGMDTVRHVTGNYYLTAPDDEEQLGLTYRYPGDDTGYSGIIEETVFAVGYNKQYIIAKQHPHDIKETTNYFILPYNANRNPKNEDLIGPLTLNEFNQKKKEFRIENLNFTIIYKDLE
jgi:hypothetical protein